VDQVFLLWISGKASGFVTLRRPEIISGLFREEMDNIDTVFIRKSARGQGFMSNFLVNLLLLRKNTTTTLAFSEPLSTNMLKCILR
jgi:hypothetical protein